MIKATFHDNGVTLQLTQYLAATGRAAEKALDKVAGDIKDANVRKMKSVFDNPTRYTLNSLKVTRTKNHNMTARVWFKEPDRMEQHYLVPQVVGGQRKLKGFERALAQQRYVPGRGARMTQDGNISTGQIRQVLSVLGIAEVSAGYQANLTAKSALKNKKARDYIYLPRGSRRGNLPPGVYERIAQQGRGIGVKQRKTIVKFGTHQKGRTSGKFSSVIRARGLRAIMVKGRQNMPTKPLLPFYEVAENVYEKNFLVYFNEELSRNTNS